MKISKAWGPFEVRLADTLAALQDGHYLILDHPATGHYVQFAAQGPDGLRAEARANVYIPPARQLGPAEETRLIELGWKPPTHGPEDDEREPDGSVNWYQDWEPPVPWTTVAEGACLTLRDVYGVRHPSSLRYEAFARGGVPLLLPGLGRRHSIRPPRPETVQVEYRSELEGAIKELLPQLVEEYLVGRLDNGDLLTHSPAGDMAIAIREEPFRILFYTTVLADVDGGPQVLEALNERNQTLLLGRVYWLENRVLFDHVIPAQPFVPAQFLRVHREMHEQSLDLAAELQPLVGGTLPD